MKKKIKPLIVVCIVFPLLLVVISNYIIEKQTEKLTFFSTTEIKKNKVGLVLGTSKLLNNGSINLYFKYRIDATLKLYKSKKIDFILISGDNGNKTYDEPTDFKEELISKGIPEEKIFLDYAGFRTLDSIVRAKKIFGQENITIISQQFHNQRAIYLAKHHNINAIGFNAKDVSASSGFKVRAREYLARTKVFIDILLGVKPKFLGKQVEIK
ncbi:ElyC/SanA/YdcF family protein [Postechiella marina]|uniref:ElyC/SanA/YdcF family protein n=1 Tax=Postechiella marina TaxID=943941 RepID=A0ABP8CA75_9FLAO